MIPDLINQNNNVYIGKVGVTFTELVLKFCRN